MLNVITYGAIDIGSNAIRLIITDVYQHHNKIQYKKISLVRVPIRLGEDVFTQGIISEQKLSLLTQAMAGFAHLMQAYSTKTYRACATSAMREAKNRVEVIKHIKAKTGIQIEIISGDEESSLIYIGGVAEYINDNRDYLYVDVGGGSTEIILYSKNKKIAAKSFPIGTVRTISHAVKPTTKKEMVNWLKTTLEQHPEPILIGSGGNINKFQKLIDNKAGKPIGLKKLQEIHDKLSLLTYEERLTGINLCPHRADVIVPAMDIFITIMKTVKAKKIIVPKTGLADGIIRQLYSNNLINTSNAETT